MEVYERVIYNDKGVKVFIEVYKLTNVWRWRFKVDEERADGTMKTLVNKSDHQNYETSSDAMYQACKTIDNAVDRKG